MVAITRELDQKIRAVEETRYQADMRTIAAFADRVFACLMAVQFLAAVAAAIWWTPFTWIGLQSSIHVHVQGAVLIGAVLTSLVIYLTLSDPGRPSNAVSITLAQISMSILLIHLTGGRIETHFHIFGSLAFLSKYRRPEVLALGTLLVAVDHGFRGIVWPQSVFGVADPTHWRWLEHTGWVIFEDVVLFAMIHKSRSEMRAFAAKWALLSVNNEVIDAEVTRQTAEIDRQRKDLSESAIRLRTVIDTAHDAYLCLDHNRNICDWSRGAELLAGWKSVEVLGKPCSEVLKVVELEDQLKSAMEVPGYVGGPKLIETRAETAAGGSIPVEASWSLARHESNLTVNVFLRDITERRESSLRQLHAQKMESIGQLAAGIAHEINTPCQFVGDNLHYLAKSIAQIETLIVQLEDEDTNAEIAVRNLRDKFSEKKLKKLRAEIPLAISQSVNGIERIGTLTRAMKSFSHPGKITMEPTDLNAAIANTIIVCRNEWKYVAELETAFDESLPSVLCLPSELNQVWINLIVNAAHAIDPSMVEREGEKGKIRLSTHYDCANSTVEIVVEDDGMGIPDEIRQRIFDPFFTTKEVGKGTGQGLAIAHSVIAKHHGRIKVESEVGKGTRFVVELPVQRTSMSDTFTD